MTILSITTENTDEYVRNYVTYRELRGVEIEILDCMGFLRHFLHLLYRPESNFLCEYQSFVSAQPDNEVS